MALDEMHSGFLKELVDEVAKPIWIIFEKTWQSGEVSIAWKRGNVTLSFKKGKRKTQGTTGLTFVSGKIMEQILQEIMHMENKEVAGDNQQG